MSFKDKLNKDKIPTHVAIIMDGNGRWAKQRGNNRLFGHKQGAVSVQTTVEAALEIGVKYITIYAFSTENWSRPKAEVDGLMMLLDNAIQKEMEKLIKSNVCVKVIGDISKLPSKVAKGVQKAIDQTKNNTGLTLVVALNYSSRWEITNAVQNIARSVENGELKAGEITEDIFKKHLTTNGIPDPELLIRTSGEQRISNFLLWQISYSELYFTPVLWPDFDKEVFFEAIYEFQQRERRFGKTSEQING